MSTGRDASDVRATLDEYYSIRLGLRVADVGPGQLVVAACYRRTMMERGVGAIRPLWIMDFGDRAAISVHPAASAEVARLAWGLPPDEIWHEGFCERAAAAVRDALPGLPAEPLESEVTLYHPGGARSVPTDLQIRPLVPGDVARWPAPTLNVFAPRHASAARGEAYGVATGDNIAAWVITQESACAEVGNRVVSEGIETAEGHQRRGYGKALLAYWTREMQAKGRICLHDTSADNAASLALARSVGYVEYGRSWFVAYRSPVKSQPGHA